MTTPQITYDSDTNLSLGNVPQIDDPKLYRELLDIHNAIENLLKNSDANFEILLAFLAKFRNVTNTTVDYTILDTDGTIEVDASSNDVIITLPAANTVVGYRFDIKRVDQVPANTVTILGDGTELIDDRASGIKVSTKSSYTVKTNNDNDGWNII